MKRAACLILILASAPAAAQSGGCVRDPSGTLNCTGTRYSDPRVGLGATRMPRHILTPQLRTRADAQMQAILDDGDAQRRQSDVLLNQQRLNGCVAALLAAGTARARAEQSCDR